MRSVFVSQLSARVTDRELALFFEQQAGKVREAKVIVDRISRRSKGWAPALKGARRFANTLSQCRLRRVCRSRNRLQGPRLDEY
mgnify:FL=1